MKTAFKFVVLLMFAVLLLKLFGHHHGITVNVDGDEWDVLGDGIGDGLGELIGLGVMLVLVPLALLLGVGLPLLILGAVFGALMLAGALICSPLLLFIGLLVLLLRRNKSRGAARRGGPNIAA